MPMPMYKIKIVNYLFIEIFIVIITERKATTPQVALVQLLVKHSMRLIEE